MIFLVLLVLVIVIIFGKQLWERLWRMFYRRHGISSDSGSDCSEETGNVPRLSDSVPSYGEVMRDEVPPSYEEAVQEQNFEKPNSEDKTSSAQSSQLSQ